VTTNAYQSLEAHRTHRRDGRRARLFGLLAVIVGLAAACGGGSSVSSSPAQASRDLFAAIQANDCNRAYALQTRALDAEEGGKAKACGGFTQLSARYRGNTFRVLRVDRHGDRADVFTERINPDGSVRTATLGTKVKDRTWKVNSLTRTSPAAGPTSS